MKFTMTGKIDFTIDKRPWGIKMDALLPLNTNTRVEILSAQNPLSLHVHPISMDEIYIFKENGSLYLDLKHDTTLRDFERIIHLKIDPSYYLNKINALAGEMFFIPGGVVHGLAQGTVYEIINKYVNCKMCKKCLSCNTFRVFDWNRNNRPLQLEVALNIIKEYRALNK